MDQKTREEFEKLSKADQEWTLEVFRLEKFNALAALAEDKPNLWRVAEEIAKRKNPDMVLNALQSVLSARERGGPEGRQ